MKVAFGYGESSPVLLLDGALRLLHHFPLHLAPHPQCVKPIMAPPASAHDLTATHQRSDGNAFEGPTLRISASLSSIELFLTADNIKKSMCKMTDTSTCNINIAHCSELRSLFFFCAQAPSRSFCSASSQSKIVCLVK